MKLTKGDLTYISRKVTLTKNNIKRLVTPQWARQIYKPNINKIYKDIINGIGLHSVFAANEVNNKLILIDGNHRKEAIIKAFNNDIITSIEVRFHIYKNLDDEKSREIWNIYETKKIQTKLDKFKLYADEIPVLKKLLNTNSNYKIYYNESSKEGVYPIIRFLECYITRNMSFGGYGSDHVLNEAKKLDTITDYINIEHFIRDYTEAFGKPYGKNNIFYRTTPMYIISKIYFYAKNVMKMNKTMIIEHLENMKKVTDLYPVMKSGGITQCNMYYKTFVDIFNRRLRVKMPYFLEK